MKIRFRSIAILTVVVGMTWGAPGSLLATLLKREVPADRSQQIERLTELRELAERRGALLRELTRQTDALDVEIIDLRRERRAEDAALSEARSRLEELERELDFLVPRLLEREAAVAARRDAARRALSHLADVSRETRIDPEVRARLLAVSPVMLERLRGAEASASGLRIEEERRAAEHRRLLAEAPAMLEARQRIEAARERAQLRRRALADRISEVRADVASLEAEQRQLADVVAAAQDARRLRAEPQVDQPMGPLAAMAPMTSEFPRAPARQAEAASRGEVSGQARLSGAVGAMQQSPAPVLAKREQTAPRLTADADVQTVIGPPPAKPRGVDTPAATSVASGFAETPKWDAADASAAAQAGVASQVTAAQLEVPTAPMLPVPGEVIAGGQPRLVRGDRDPALVIAARPGQVVAAPESGRVVFAGTFKRYGLLLMIEHAPDYHTLLWGFSDLRVQRGDRVRVGQIVGVMGAAGDGRADLHMEVRRNGQPVNPLLWMAASTSKVQG